MSHPLATLREALATAVAEAGGDASRIASCTLEPPSREEHGDFATNAAMVCAGGSGGPPREFAQQLGESLAAILGGQLERFDVAGPGFLNLFLADSWFREALGAVAAAGDRFASAGSDGREPVLVEFVSANPTGPLTAAGGRHAAYGDSLARLLEFAGHEVSREYYVNDAGAQVRRLGQSIIARARGEEVPEDGYSGEYVADLAAEIDGAAEGEPDAVAAEGVRLLTGRIERTLARYRVEFDRWFSERSLYEGDPNAVERAADQLRQGGQVFEQDGALWLRTTGFGDDKDRVLVRSDGEPTYFAADIAYHADKLRRCSRLIDVLGADHHGYVARMKAAVAALGDDPERLEMVIMQFVHLVEGDGRAQMSKRRGEFVTLDELIDLIGVDAARWYMLARSHDTTVDLDLDLARERTADNPVYYVQYAHARCMSVLAKSAVSVGAPEPTGPALHPSERALIRRLVGFPDEVVEAADRRAVHRICAWVLQLAQDFTAFYRDCRVIGAPEAEERFRVALAASAGAQIAAALALLGVEAPDEL